jgi:hypothetical protein
VLGDAVPERANQFVKKYHKAMVMATKDQTEKVKAKIVRLDERLGG